jgi:hypothetical protein
VAAESFGIWTLTDGVPDRLEFEVCSVRVDDVLGEADGCDCALAVLGVSVPLGGAASIEARDEETSFCWDMPQANW